jgi:hypothetical protein
MWAVPIEWPYSAAKHAESVASPSDEYDGFIAISRAPITEAVAEREECAKLVHRIACEWQSGMRRPASSMIEVGEILASAIRNREPFPQGEAEPASGWHGSIAAAQGLCDMPRPIGETGDTEPGATRLTAEQLMRDDGPRYHPRQPGDTDELVEAWRWRWNDSPEWSVTEYDPRTDASVTRLARLGEIYPLTPLSALTSLRAERGRLAEAYGKEQDAHMRLSDQHSEQMNKDAARIMSAESSLAAEKQRNAELTAERDEARKQREDIGRAWDSADARAVAAEQRVVELEQKLYLVTNDRDNMRDNVDRLETESDHFPDAGNMIKAAEEEAEPAERTSTQREEWLSGQWTLDRNRVLVLESSLAAEKQRADKAECHEDAQLSAIGMLTSRAEAAEQRVAVLEGMLKPFAKFAKHIAPGIPDDRAVIAGPSHMWEAKITAGELRAALAETGEGQPCDHKHYDSAKHGRRCTCGASMWDAGD